MMFFFPAPEEANEQKVPENDTLKVERYNEQAWQAKNSDPDDARRYALDAITLAEEVNYPKGIADGYHNLGMVQWRSGDRAGALDYYLRSLDIRQRINDSLGLGRSYNNIGNVYYAQENYDSAQIYYESGRLIRLDLEDVSGLIYSLSNLGDVALKNDSIARAADYYNESEKLARQANNPIASAHVLGRLGTLALLTDNNEDALEYWREALAYAESTDDNRLIVTSLQELVRTMMVEQERVLPEQETYARRSLELAAENNLLDLQTEGAMLLAQLSALEGDFKDVYAYQEQYRQLTKSLLERRKNEAVTAVRKNYAEEQNATRKLLKEKEARSRLEARNNQLVFGFLIIGLLLLSALVISSFLAYRKQYALARELETKNEELAVRYKDLRELAKIASHDLKEPLRNIGSFASLLQRRYSEKLDESGVEYLGFVMDGVGKMENLLNDLLTLASIRELGEKKMEPVRLAPLLRKSFTQQVELLNINGNIELADLPQLKGNAKLLEMLFDQLFQNALKFNNSSSPEVKVDSYLDGKYHVITIADNGIGINTDYQKQIFNIFERLDRKNPSGTGIGLTICRRVIDIHRGEIWLESELGIGTTFFIKLPTW